MKSLSRPGRLGWVQAKTPLALPGQRIGLLGGSFNPPHAGHVQIAQIALARLQLDHLWWLVSPGNPLKSNNELPSQGQRMAACRRLVDSPKIDIVGFEAALGTPYTAASVAYLRQRYPATRFVWIMGADNLATFHLWQHWQRIAHQVPIAVVDRPGWRHAALASPMARAFAGSYRPEAEARLLPLQRPPAWTLLSGPLSPLSSTAIRARQRSGAGAGA